MATLIPSLHSCLFRMSSGEKRLARVLESHLEDDYLFWCDVPILNIEIWHSRISEAAQIRQFLPKSQSAQHDMLQVLADTCPNSEGDNQDNYTSVVSHSRVNHQNFL